MNSQNSESIRLIPEDGDWVLVFERVLEHPRTEVWAALTQSGRVIAWGPFAPDRDLTAPGAVRLTPVNMPGAEAVEGFVFNVDAPCLLVMRWGADILRWELIADGDRTVLILHHRFADRRETPSYAAGWHLCLEGLTGALAGKELPSMAGQNAAKYGWRELYARYAEQLGIDPS